MGVYADLLILLVGLMAGFIAAWLLQGREATRLEGEIRHLAAERDATADRADSLRRELHQEQLAHAALGAEHGASQRAHAENLAALAALRGEIETKLKALAAEALHGSQESFLALAGQVFETHRQSAAALLEQKEQAIANLVSPVAAALDAYQKGLGEFEKAHAVLRSEVHQVGAQAHKLVSALQASPKTRGRWGEQQLQNVIELAGLTDHIDYNLQQTIEGEDGRQRPDLVIRLPGERFLVVDAKTPLTAYFDANEATDDAGRESHLQRHSQQVRTHMKQLGSKRYWEALRPVTPDFVVMFIPGENFYRAAFERDSELLVDGWRDRVLVASPTTLIGLAMTVAFSWQREEAAENARQVGELGRDLYRRLATMGNHVVQLGNSLRRTVEHYGSFVGSLEGSVMPQARRFRDLKVDGTGDPLPELKPLELLPRELHSGSELHGGLIEVVAPAAE